MIRILGITFLAIGGTMLYLAYFQLVSQDGTVALAFLLSMAGAGLGYMGYDCWSRPDV